MLSLTTIWEDFWLRYIVGYKRAFTFTITEHIFVSEIQSFNYGFLKMTFHAVCNTALKWMKTSGKVLNLKVHRVRSYCLSNERDDSELLKQIPSRFMLTSTWNISILRADLGKLGSRWPNKVKIKAYYKTMKVFFNLACMSSFCWGLPNQNMNCS